MDIYDYRNIQKEETHPSEMKNKRRLETRSQTSLTSPQLWKMKG